MFKKLIKNIAISAVIIPAVVPVLMGSAFAAYPDKPIKVIIGFPAGGPLDAHMRLLVEKLQAILGQPVIVDYKAGAGGTVGAQFVAQSPADGYALLLANTGTMVINPAVYTKTSYETLKEFQPIARTAQQPLALIVNKDVPAQTLKEFIAYAKANPGKLNFGTSGPGTGQFILASLIKGLGNVDIQLVPYKGAQPVYMDLLGGRVDLFFDNTTTTRTYLESNQLKAFAVSSRQRAPDGPQIPTLLETGTLDLEMETWFGLFAPAKTPPAVVEKLRAEIDKAMQSADVRKKLQQGSGRIVQMNNAETENMLKSEATKWPRLRR